MYSRYLMFYTLVLRPILIGRYLYCHSLEIANVNNVILNVTLDNRKDVRDLRLFYSILLLEFISMRRPFIKLIKTVYRSKTKSLILVVNLDLRFKNSLNFIELLIGYIFPCFKQKHVEVVSTFNTLNSAISISFSDVANFIDIPPIFYKWIININVTLFLTNVIKSSNKDIIDLFWLLGFGLLKSA